MNSVDERIVALAAGPVTATLLRHDASHFDELSTTDAERLRAHVLALFETRSATPDAVQLIVEELKTSASPVVLAGAARAVRGIGSDAGVDWVTLLTDAADRIAARDAFVRWHPAVVTPGWMRTARDEILAARDTVPTRAQAHRVTPAGPEIPIDAAALAEIIVEDQAAERIPLADLLREGPTVVAFFYTRCMNPLKCSLTVTRLAALAARDDGPRILAITYDPDYDSPPRLRRYGDDRRFPFGEGSRFVRCVAGWQSLRRMLRLQVGYGPTTVNEHAREAFLVRDQTRFQGIAADVFAEPAWETLLASP